MGSRAVKKPGVACAGMPAGASSDGKASVAAWIAVGAASSGSNTGSLGEAPVAGGWGGGGGGGGGGCSCPSAVGIAEYYVKIARTHVALNSAQRF